jgi:ABC-type glycerol-3-phosphate transport system permease component
MRDDMIDALRYVMPQKKKHSILEAVLSTFIGFFVSLAAGYVLYQHFDMRTHSGIITVTAIFTVLSVVRGYYVRRLFNWLHRKNYL